MKCLQTYLVILLTVVNGIVASAQPGAPSLNDSTGVWRVDFITDNGSGGTWFSFDQYQYAFGGDTVLGGNVYAALYKGGHSWEGDFYQGTTWNHAYYNHVYCGAVREQDGKWYIYGSNGVLPEQEHLLYDFTLNAGDELPPGFCNYGAPLTVTSVDTVLINAIERRRLFIGDNPGPGATFYIEGVGSNAGLIEPMQQFEYLWNLVCYAEEGVPVWNEPGSSCDLTVGVPACRPGEEALRVSPNPVKGVARIDFPAIKTRGQLELIDLQGRILQRSDLVMGQTTYLLFPSVGHGIYVIRLIAPDRVAFQKLRID